MTVKTIIDMQEGRKWDIIKQGEDQYDIVYSEFFQSIGWRLINTDRNYSKDCVEWEFDIELA